MAQLLDTGLEVPEMERLPALRLPQSYAGRDVADALMVPVGYMQVTAEYLIERMIQIRFGKVVRADGNGMLHVRSPLYQRYFVTGDPADLINNPKTHWTRAGLPRYEWFPDPDPKESGVLYGFLIGT